MDVKDDASFFVEANEFAFNGQSVAYEWLAITKEYIIIMIWKYKL